MFVPIFTSTNHSWIRTFSFSIVRSKRVKSEPCSVSFSYKERRASSGGWTWEYSVTPRARTHITHMRTVVVKDMQSLTDTVKSMVRTSTKKFGPSWRRRWWSWWWAWDDDDGTHGATGSIAYYYSNPLLASLPPFFLSDINVSSVRSTVVVLQWTELSLWKYLCLSLALFLCLSQRVIFG